MPKAYIVFVRNHFFGNNSGKSEPIMTKSYRDTYVQSHVARYYANLWRPLTKGAQNGAEKNHFAKLFCQQKLGSFTKVSQISFRFRA